MIVNHLVYYQPMKQSTSRKRAASDEEAHLDRIFHALADRTRRAMLSRLAQGGASVTQLAEPFEMSLPAVSKHLKVLEEAGLVGRSIEGRVHHCALEPEALRDANQWLETYRQFWDETLESLARYVEGTHDEGQE
jgi:DNA-binding transcriptional ArsR family regulator